MYKKLIYFLILIFWFEIISLISLVLLGRRLPNVVFNSENYNFYLDSSKKNLLDPLGWGIDKIRKSTIVPASSCRVHLFGDSFMNFEPYKKLEYKNKILSPEDIINIKTGCKIFNYGVGGYGSDQAYLKFKDQISKRNILPGDYVILSHLTENILRNSTRNLRLLYPMPDSNSTMLKPKFKLNNNGELSLISIPKELTELEFSEINRKGFTAKTMIDENLLLLPNFAKGSPSKIEFPYTFNLIKTFFSWHLYPRYFGEEKWYPFYKENSSYYLVTRKIFKEFHSISLNNDYKPITLDLPTAYDLKKFFKSNENKFRLTKELNSFNLNHYSFGDYLTINYPETLKDKCLFYDGNQDGGDDCKFHFNKKGYLLMINFISELINNYQIRTF